MGCHEPCRGLIVLGMDSDADVCKLGPCSLIGKAHEQLTRI